MTRFLEKIHKLMLHGAKPTGRFKNEIEPELSCYEISAELVNNPQELAIVRVPEYIFEFRFTSTSYNMPEFLFNTCTDTVKQFQFELYGEIHQELLEIRHCNNNMSRAKVREKINKLIDLITE